MLADFFKWIRDGVQRAVADGITAGLQEGIQLATQRQPPAIDVEPETSPKRPRR
jgi:hypothetical protein